MTGYDFDVLVGGHLTRLGTKADVQVKIDFYDDVLKGAEAGLAVVTVPDVIAGTGVFSPGNVNEGNTWCVPLHYHAPSPALLIKFPVYIRTLAY